MGIEPTWYSGSYKFMISTEYQNAVYADYPVINFTLIYCLNLRAPMTMDALNTSNSHMSPLIALRNLGKSLYSINDLSIITTYSKVNFDTLYPENQRDALTIP